ncbi:MAG TPA: nucleotidyltransferase domain-containing protein [Candidatus Binatia bacterium]|nr:nucleotidyltransferase domain-containing protein [Candidatus Binatia bacterium]
MANFAAAAPYLSNVERSCVERYVALVAERLGSNLLDVWLFGSAARGDMWGAHMPMHSDIDVLVLTADAVAPAAQDELIDETYPLFLECGRQIAPQFKVADEFRTSTSAHVQTFRQRVDVEGTRLFP